MVDRGAERTGTEAARRVGAEQIPQHREAERLVEHHPVTHPIAESTYHSGDVVAVPADDVAVGPPAASFECCGKVPVVQRDPRFDSGSEARVDDPRVVVDARRVDAAGARRHHAGPRDREAVRAESHRCDERDVFLVAVVGVCGHVSRSVVLDPRQAERSPPVGELVPDRRALAVGVPSALDLVRRGGHTPTEVLAEVGAINLGHAPTMVTRSASSSITR